MMSESHELSIRRTNIRLLNEDFQSPKILGPIIGYAEEPLLPLAEACAPLIDIVHDLFRYVWIALERTPDDPADGLTRAESASIHLYTMEWPRPHKSLYSILNHTLRTSDRENLRPWFKYLKLFLTALAKAPCASPEIVWRGVKKNISNEFPDGAQVTWWSFSSCTTRLTVLESDLYLGRTGERTLFSIEVFNGRNVRAHSHFDTEDEVLMLPGTYLEIKSQLNPAPDLYLIHLKQKIPEEILLEPPFEGACLYPKVQRHWYRKKRYLFPICSLMAVCFVAIIVGSILGTRSNNVSTNATASICRSPFPAPVNYKMDAIPTAITLNNFNNKETLDLAVANRKDNAINVLFGNEDGTFQQYDNNPETGKSPLFVALGDFNNDKKTDLVVANQGQNTISLLLGNGGGTFKNQTIFPTGYGPTAVITGDFNRDKRSDVVVTNRGENTIGLLLGNGFGTFRNQIMFATGYGSSCVITGDFNSDNQLDVVVSNSGQNTISLLLGNGNGTFQKQRMFATGNSPFSVITNDFNRDNKLDLAVTNYYSNTISLLLGNGDGTFKDQMAYATGNNSLSVVAGDFNRDSKLDLVVANSGSNTVSLLLGNGDGTFRNHVMYTTGNNPRSVTSGDFNNDKKLDVVVANYDSDAISLLFGNGDGTFQKQIMYAADTGPSFVIAGDFNSDNKLDLAVVNEKSGDLSVLLNSC